MRFDSLATVSFTDIQVLALVSSILLFFFIVALIRNGKLKEGYSITWFVIGLIMIIFAIAPDLLEGLADLVGISYTPAALFLILIGGLFLLSIKYSVLASDHDRRIRELAQEHAILKAQVESGKMRRLS